ncbi:hypothetical protein DFH09DRAFT_1313791 [Mycena vulgaris]|nr:hypothetical protein DFH09DRAFT_1313773 [Mycena vulgaris]KAJ6568338.1 hypothetical protein DFH09DRAFT_1313791 [Mycena vulgaris]
MLDNAIIVPRQIRQILLRHAESLEDSDSESDFDDSDHEERDDPIDHHKDTFEETVNLAPGPPSPSSSSGNKRKHLDEEDAPTSTLKRHRSSSTPNPDLASPPLDPVQRKKLKKKLSQRAQRNEQRQVQRSASSIDQKAVNAVRTCQSSPISVPFHISEHTRPVASTGWMGLRDGVIQDAAD